MQSGHIVGEDFCGSVDRYVDDCAVRLLVMVTHQKGGLRRLFHASLTRKMACHSRIPPDVAACLNIEREIFQHTYLTGKTES
jgi:hypothetical protein